MDLVALRKEQWSGVEWLTHGMRIDEDMLLGLRRKDFAKLKPVYKHKAVNSFLAALDLLPAGQLFGFTGGGLLPCRCREGGTEAKPRSRIRHKRGRFFP